MRMMYAMMHQQGTPGSEGVSNKQIEELAHNQTLEINPAHPLLVKLNDLRKHDMQKANKIAKLFLDQILVKNAIPFDTSESSQRNIEMMDDYLRMRTENSQPLDDV